MGLFGYIIPEDPWISMPAIIDDRSTENAVYIGHRISNDAVFDSSKVGIYRAAGIAWIQDPNTTDAELEDMDNTAIAAAAASDTSRGAAPDLID